jgi:hypothetical protein
MTKFKVCPRVSQSMFMALGENVHGVSPLGYQ